MRLFMRHPSTIPIEVTSDPDSHRDQPELRNVSHGGLCYHATERMAPGETVRIRIPLVADDFETSARVTWCQANSHGYLIGVQFLHEDDAYRTRMIEQLCHIEEYRRDVLDKEGRRLTPQQAAMEWIEKYAEHFPNPLQAKTG